MATIVRSTPSPFVMAIVNPVVEFLVRRGRGPIAKRLMVLHWTGRKTGTAYSTPVSRHEFDGRLFTKTRAGYKYNFVGGGPAELIVDGERRPVVGTTIDDPEIVGRRMRAVLDELGTKQGARALSLKIEGDPKADELARFAADDGLVVLDFTPT
ncbi:MAG: hypothetical protein AAFO29_18020 [Actinomycetota bacterium]